MEFLASFGKNFPTSITFFDPRVGSHCGVTADAGSVRVDDMRGDAGSRAALQNHCALSEKLCREMVGASGVEPLTSTVSR